jgi:hypothetical protein
MEPIVIAYRKDHSAVDRCGKQRAVGAAEGRRMQMECFAEDRGFMRASGGSPAPLMELGWGSKDPKKC